MITSTQIDNALNLFDNTQDLLPFISGWCPSKQTLIDHKVEENFDEYALFLLFISESINNYKEQKNMDINLSPTELRETELYINKLFREHTVDDYED